MIIPENGSKVKWKFFKWDENTVSCQTKLLWIIPYLFIIPPLKTVWVSHRPLPALFCSGW